MGRAGWEQPQHTTSWGRLVGFHLRGLATTLAFLPYLLNHLPVLQKTLVQALLSESLSAVSQEKQLNPQGGN